MRWFDPSPFHKALKGGKMAEGLDYIPMPEPVVKLIEKTWSTEIKS